VLARKIGYQACARGQVYDPNIINVYVL
jgi:hypothetical protein